MLKIQEIREIIKLIDDSSINEFTYETDGTKIKLKKASENTAITQIQKVIEPVAQPPVDTLVEETVMHTEEKKTVTEHSQNTTETTVDYDYEIISPMVGTLYNAASPENDPYVTVGSNVTKDSVVCIVEAMKLFNEIEAEVSGEIVEILVEDGELVEYGQPLYRVKTK